MNWMMPKANLYHALGVVVEVLLWILNILDLHQSSIESSGRDVGSRSSLGRRSLGCLGRLRLVSLLEMNNLENSGHYVLYVYACVFE